MTRVFNFSAGPAMLPTEVLEEVAEEMLDYQGSGQSVMEMSHRGKIYEAIHEQAQVLLRELLSIPDDYHVLFVQGGASLQFSAIPLNLAPASAPVAYVHTGIWSRKASEEAQRLGYEVHVAASSASDDFISIPKISEWRYPKEAAYLHYVANETIGGVEFQGAPHVALPLVCDMSSNILSRPIEVARYALIYAGAQKNIGPSGLTLVIVHKDFVGKARRDIPLLLDYRTYAEHQSMYNTPPTYAIYIASLVFAWLQRQGGLVAMEKRNREKSAALYSFLDQSDFFRSPIPAPYRSCMNVPFLLRDPQWDDLFLQGAERRGLVGLKGHRLLGGMRASLYNAMPMEGVQALLHYMHDFSKQYAE